MDNNTIKKLKKQRDRLFQKTVVNLMQNGAKGLNPLEKYKRDKDKKITIATNHIENIFFKIIKEFDFLHAYEYFEYLDTFLKIFTQGAGKCVFKKKFTISEQIIVEADNKIKIEFLTKNIIYNFFNKFEIKVSKNKTSFPTHGLEAVIKQNEISYNYKTLVEDTLKKLTVSLEEKKEWKAYIDDFNNASLVCKLIGTNLPEVNQEVISNIIVKARNELISDNDMFSKIINTENKIHSNISDAKKYADITKQLDAATDILLKKIDIYLLYAQRLVITINISPKKLLGVLDTSFKQNLVRMFFDNGLEDNINFSTMRYKINRLFKYKSITGFCKLLQYSEHHKDYFLNVFKLHYKMLLENINRLNSTEPFNTDTLKRSLSEIQKFINKLSLDKEVLLEEKHKIIEAYIVTLEKCHHDNINSLMELNYDLLSVTRNSSKDTMENIQNILIQKAFDSLDTTEEILQDKRKLKANIQQILYVYAVHFKPQKSFYQFFFNRYIIDHKNSVSPHLMAFYKKKPKAALTILSIFSDPQYAAKFISETQMETAKTILTKAVKKKSLS